MWHLLPQYVVTYRHFYEDDRPVDGMGYTYQIFSQTKNRWWLDWHNKQTTGIFPKLVSLPAKIDGLTWWTVTGKNYAFHQQKCGSMGKTLGLHQQILSSKQNNMGFRIIIPCKYDGEAMTLETRWGGTYQFWMVDFINTKCWYGVKWLFVRVEFIG